MSTKRLAAMYGVAGAQRLMDRATEAQRATIAVEVENMKLGDDIMRKLKKARPMPPRKPVDAQQVKRQYVNRYVK